MPNRVCTRCDGDGYQYVDEGPDYGPPIKDACYHCDNGFITEEQWQADRLERLSDILGGVAVARERASRNENPDGEDWAFCAAENQCSEYEYTQGRLVENTLHVQAELKKLDPWVLAVLLDQIVPDTQPTEAIYKAESQVVIEQRPAIIGVNQSDPPENDDIPF